MMASAGKDRGLKNARIAADLGGLLIQASPLTKRHQAHYARDNTGAAQVVRLVERVKPGLHRQARRGSATKSPSSRLATATAARIRHHPIHDHNLRPGSLTVPHQRRRNELAPSALPRAC
jgi:hypothetical protein